MKKAIMFGAFSFLAASAVAHATDQGQSGSSDAVRINLFCEFHEKSAAALSSDDEQQSFKKCAAAARVTVRKDKDDDQKSKTSSEVVSGEKNLLAVACDNELIYADGAKTVVRDRVLKIVGKGGTPVIVIRKKDDDGQTGDRKKKVDAVLKIDDEKLKGTCKVDVDPIKDDDSQHNGDKEDELVRNVMGTIIQ